MGGGGPSCERVVSSPRLAPSPHVASRRTRSVGRLSRWTGDSSPATTYGSDAARLALSLDRPVHDCVYLALAHRIGARVVTADERFANALATTEHSHAVVTLKALSEGRR